MEKEKMLNRKSLSDLITENQESLEQLRRDINHIIKTIIDLIINDAQKETSTENQRDRHLLELIERYQEQLSREPLDRSASADQSFLRNLYPSTANFLLTLEKQVITCSTEAIDANQIKSIEDLNQLMNAFHVFSEKITDKKPILEDILESLASLLHRPIGVGETIIPLLCGLIAELLINVVVGGFLGALIGLTGAPTLGLWIVGNNLLSFLDDTGFIYKGIALLSLIIPLCVAFFLPLPFFISYCMVLQGINVLLGAGWAIIANHLETYTSVHASVRNFLFFKPPSKHEAIRNDIRNFADNSQGLFKKFLKSDFVLERPDMKSDLSNQVTKHTNIHSDISAIINSYTSEAIRNRSSLVDMQIGKICNL
ncbi:MAG: hypothetical protein K0R24_866 [Gammaproteobacteria bacterium]|jgi:hypothetical protein|nr:hypothetical protein [Gammaproteobacteria bacterium]